MSGEIINTKKKLSFLGLLSKWPIKLAKEVEQISTKINKISFFFVAIFHDKLFLAFQIHHCHIIYHWVFLIFVRNSFVWFIVISVQFSCWLSAYKFNFIKSWIQQQICTNLIRKWITICLHIFHIRLSLIDRILILFDYFIFTHQIYYNEDKKKCIAVAETNMCENNGAIVLIIFHSQCSKSFYCRKNVTQKIWIVYV